MCVGVGVFVKEDRRVVAWGSRFEGKGLSFLGGWH